MKTEIILSQKEETEHRDLVPQVAGELQSQQERRILMASQKLGAAGCHSGARAGNTQPEVMSPEARDGQSMNQICSGGLASRNRDEEGRSSPTELDREGAAAA